MFDRIHATNNVLEKGLQAAIIKNDVLQNNVANADTPNYKRQIVNFEDSFLKEVEKSKSTGSLNVKNIIPTVEVDSTSNRLDGNGVDINVEMVELYKNSVKYDVLIRSITNNLQRINMALGR